ncbi:hypothetical protein BDW22DRAFT_842329 [Trametopsis cervina]|nr:hypothetical protein BDW22DRAFT_842329 [Trametopsis cervina]
MVTARTSGCGGHRLAWTCADRTREGETDETDGLCRSVGMCCRRRYEASTTRSGNGVAQRRAKNPTHNARHTHLSRWTECRRCMYRSFTTRTCRQQGSRTDKPQASSLARHTADMSDDGNRWRGADVLPRADPPHQSSARRQSSTANRQPRRSAASSQTQGRKGECVLRCRLCANDPLTRREG